MKNKIKIGLGGGCHWCTEGIFRSLKGILNVDQGWISGSSPYEDLSEGIIIEFDNKIIPLKTIIEIHLITHSSSSLHSLRKKYRSAIYVFNEEQYQVANDNLRNLSKKLETEFITNVIYFKSFKKNKPEQLDYFYSRPQAPFCRTYIIPKLKSLLDSHGNILNSKALNIIENNR